MISCHLLAPNKRVSQGSVGIRVAVVSSIKNTWISLGLRFSISRSLANQMVSTPWAVETSIETTIETIRVAVVSSIENAWVSISLGLRLRISRTLTNQVIGTQWAVETSIETIRIAIVSSIEDTWVSISGWLGTGEANKQQSDELKDKKANFNIIFTIF